jgi:hypothetical protein
MSNGIAACTSFVEGFWVRIGPCFSVGMPSSSFFQVDACVIEPASRQIPPSRGTRFCRKLTHEVDQKYRGRSVSEKSVPRQQAALVRRTKNEPSEPRDLAGARFGDKFAVPRVEGAFDAQDRGPNGKFRLKRAARIIDSTLCLCY